MMLVVKRERNYVFNYIMIGFNDIECFKWFYDVVFGVFGVGELICNEIFVGIVWLFYWYDGNILVISQFFNGKFVIGVNGGIIGFKCEFLEQVKELYDVVVVYGGIFVEDLLGLCESVMGVMYLSYVLDLDGNKFCGFYCVQ